MFVFRKTQKQRQKFGFKPPNRFEVVGRSHSHTHVVQVRAGTHRRSTAAAAVAAAAAVMKLVARGALRSICQGYIINLLVIFSRDNLQAEPWGALTLSFTRGRVTTAPVLSCQLSSLPLLCKYCLRLQPSRREETVSFRVSSPLTYADEGEDKCTAAKSVFRI